MDGQPMKSGLDMLAAAQTLKTRNLHTCAHTTLLTIRLHGVRARTTEK
jgi:hypothetical protein